MERESKYAITIQYGIEVGGFLDLLNDHALDFTMSEDDSIVVKGAYCECVENALVSEFPEADIQIFGDDFEKCMAGFDPESLTVFVDTPDKAEGKRVASAIRKQADGIIDDIYHRTYARVIGIAGVLSCCLK